LARVPKMALPTRTRVLPLRTAASRSALIPMDRVSRPRPVAFNASNTDLALANNAHSATKSVDITQLLAFRVKNKASDLHLSAGLPPMIRVHGDVRRINVPAGAQGRARHGVRHHERRQRKHYEDTLECDFSFEIQGLARFRVNAFNQNRGAGAVFRTIPSKILTLEQLNCAQDLQATCR
jgi:hypothetical protein